MKIDWEDISYDFYKFRSKFTRPVKEFFHWIVKSAQYSWQVRPGNDYDWDWAYVFKMLKYKLERTRKRIKSNNIIADVDRVCRQIRIAEILIGRILEADYCQVEYKELEDKWGRITFGEGSRSGMSRMFVITDKDKEQERKDSMRLYKKKDYLKKQDWEYLFKHMQKYMQHWWD